MHEPVVHECRGLILDEADAWRVVSYPFRKFFNYGEPHAAPIDWPTARVYEKLDGSLMTLYPYRGAWHVASNGLPDAGGHVYAHDFSFAELFWRVWREKGYTLPDLGAGTCFMFELMTPFNRVIVRHDAHRLVLIGARRLGDFHEIPLDDAASGTNWEVVRSFPLGCLADCLAAAESLKPVEAEGYVVCDAAFNRIKVKGAQYVALTHLKESVSPRRLLDIVRANESDEFLAYFPEWRPAYESVRARFDGLCAELEAAYERIKGIGEQKAFALEAVKTRCPGALFALRAGTFMSVRDYFAAATLQSVERTVGDMSDLLPALETKRPDIAG
jgi:hypothetical protein